jgi:hypothetical protein
LLVLLAAENFTVVRVCADGLLSGPQLQEVWGTLAYTLTIWNIFEVMKYKYYWLLDTKILYILSYELRCSNCFASQVLNMDTIYAQQVAFVTHVENL